MSCQPPYDYVPSVAPAKNAHTPTFPEHRSRAFTGGTYFRSIEQGPRWNRISLEITDNIGGNPNDYQLTVRYDGVVVETYFITQIINMMDGTGDGIGKLRTATASSLYIEMYPRGSDVAFDNLGTDGIKLTTFSETYMSGGNGAPEDGSNIASINTGQERTMITIVTTEDDDGTSINTPPQRRVQQWNGTVWVGYQNLVQGACPLITFIGPAFPLISGGSSLIGYYDSIIADSPIAYWRLGESSGTNAVDEVGSNDGTYQNSPTLGVTGPLVSDTDTAMNIAVSSTQRMLVLDDPDLRPGLGSWSMEIWFRTTTIQFANLFTKRSSSSPFSQYSCAMSGASSHGGAGTGSHISVGYIGTAFSSERSCYTVNNGWNDGVWHHLVVVANQTDDEVYIYIDNVLQTIIKDFFVGGWPTISNVDNFSVGDNVGGGFAGDLDEMALYNYALSAAQVDDHYTAGIS